MKFWYCIFIVNICPAFCFAGHVFLQNAKPRIVRGAQFQLALAHLYAQHPELIHSAQEAVDDPEFSFDTKKIFTYSSTLIPFIYFCYESYKNSINYQHATLAEKNLIMQTMQNVFPKLLFNAPRHVTFFLQEVEILLQAYLLKLLLKMIIFCFV